MKNELILVQGNQLLVGTLSLSQGFNISHQAIKKLIVKYKDRFARVGEREIGNQILAPIPGFQIREFNQKKRRPDTEFLINEPQAMFLITLLRNNEIVLSFKEKLVKEFVKMRRFIQKLMMKKQNAEWMEKRISGKVERRIETDSIKIFIEYAISQGADPKGARHYYENISKMENKALFNLELIKIEYKNFRDIVSGLGLDALKMADRIVAKSLKDGMEKRMYYKEIYQLAKARVESFADSMGKIPLENSENIGDLSIC